MYTISLVLCAVIVLVSSVLMGRCRWYATLIPLFSAPLVNHFFGILQGFDIWWFISGALLSIFPLTTITHYKYTDKRALLGLCCVLMAFINLTYTFVSISSSPSFVPYSVSGGLLWVTTLLLLMGDFHDYITNNNRSSVSDRLDSLLSWRFSGVGYKT